ncbi:YiiX family permuted papain-like enzyme [Chitinophaga qingshengii]|uniref:YiiX family permuted papain-like enzyme n=1 Tax=Chitinophaga qingshengii TaxID=1569794 RepID=A0ABR7TUF6_9BACT|nr:YiiX family permuted papain-like enzyme [Chitinophaga qingshengii]MBC9933252.1 YiiX family permuted papain-like enzyme [Chitinophaga qingshengii]
MRLKKIVLFGALPLAALIGGGLCLTGMPVKKIQQQLPATAHAGDVIFQESMSDLSTAIKEATHSKYSHCGIILPKDGQLYVYEAVQPVRYTLLKDWIARGRKGHYVIKRLKNANSVITPATVEKMVEAGKKYNGKDYDFYFGWSDERMYCSELVWKIYKEVTGLELGELQQLKDFDLNNAAVKQQMKQIYGNKVPLTEQIISPVSMFNSPLLITVTEK